MSGSWGFGALAMDSTRVSAHTQYRALSDSSVERYLANEDYVYHKPNKAEELTPWRRFLQWVGKILKKIFGGAPSPDNIANLFYILGAGILLWAIIKLAGVDFNVIFTKKRAAVPLPFEVTEEHIHTLDFEKEITQARDQKQWRLLIRLQYLWALKKLADHDFIKVARGKTNHDYLYEVGDKNFRESLNSLIHIFEYTWYGNFEVSAAVLHEAERQFETFTRDLEG